MLGKRVLWQPKGDFGDVPGDIVAWSPSGRKALFYFEDWGFVVLDVATQRAAYTKLNVSRRGKLVGAFLSD